MKLLGHQQLVATPSVQCQMTVRQSGVGAHPPKDPESERRCCTGFRARDCERRRWRRVRGRRLLQRLARDLESRAGFGRESRETLRRDRSILACSTSSPWRDRPALQPPKPHSDNGLKKPSVAVRALIPARGNRSIFELASPIGI